MNKTEITKFIKQHNPIFYYKILCPIVHMNLLGFTRPCNTFELLYLLGSEKNSENFKKGDYDNSCVSYIPLKRLITTKIKLDDAMKNDYPWLKLAESIKKEGIKIPIIAMDTGDYRYIPIEGRHRVGAASIAYSDFDTKVPAIVVKLDEFYTIRMFKKKHPNPLSEGGFKFYDNK